MALRGMTISPEFKGYIEAMRKLESIKLRTRKEAMGVPGKLRTGNILLMVSVDMS